MLERFSRRYLDLLVSIYTYEFSGITISLPASSCPSSPASWCF